MGSLHTTRTFRQAQTKVLEKIYSNSSPQKPLRYKDFFNDYDGDKDRSFWQAMEVIGFGTAAQKTEGQAASIDAAKEGPGSAFAWVSYALKYIISPEAQMEDPKRLIKMLPGLLKYSMEQTKEYLAWNILNLGFLNAASGGYNLSVDGLSLFNTAHPVSGVSGVTYSNLLGDVALTPETLAAAQTLMAVMPDARGLLTYRTPRKLLTPVGYDSVAREVLQSVYYPYSNENRINTQYQTLEYMPVEYLTANANGPFPWFVAADKAEIGQDGHTAFFNQKFEKQRSWTNDETECVSHQAEFRATWGVVEGRGLVGSRGA